MCYNLEFRKLTFYGLSRPQYIRKSKQISGQTILSSPQDAEFNPNFAKNRDIPVIKNSVTRPGFCKMLWRKLRLREGLFITYYLLFEFVWEGVGWGWALINFAAFRMGAYSRWALIRGWALIRINTVFSLSVEHFWRFVIDQQERIW